MTIFTPESLAERWQCSARHIRTMATQGELPSFRLGGKLLRFRSEDVEAFECQSGGLPDETESSASPGTPLTESATVTALERTRPLKLTAEQRQSMRELRAQWAGK
jgi:excisionase family DNA binding protein